MSSSNDSLHDVDVQMLQHISDGYRQLRDEIGQVIVGQDQIIRALLGAVFSEGHVLIIGVPGLAKTLLVKTLAHVLDWKFRRVQFTPDMMPADIIGMELIQEERATGLRATKFIHGPIFANIILADEINRTPPKTQSALLEAMQEYNVTSLGKNYPLEKPFVVIATQNPIEQEGTYPLPEAQLDRFMFSLWVDYPSVEEEEQIVRETTFPKQINLKHVFAKEDLLAYQSLVMRIPVSDHIISYAVAIARATRPTGPAASDFAHQYVEWGAGPRASQYMIRAAKALAALDGQPTVSAAHIREVAPYVLRHRVLLNYQATGEGLDSLMIIQKILGEISEPVYNG